VLQTKFSLLVSEDRTDEYIDVGMELLKFFFRHFYDRSDLKELFGYSKKGLRNKIKITTLPSKDDKLLNEQEALLTTDEWWSIFSKTCKALHKVGRRELVLHFIYCADVSKKLEPHRNELLLMGSYTCLITGDDNLFDFMRMLYFRKSDFPLFWNLFNSIPPSNRQQKFVLRQVIKNPTNMSLIRISANYSLMNGSYKFALAQYEVAYRSDPNDYLLCLCIAVVYVHLLVQKNAQCRNTLALQSICFLYKYLKLRGPCQESYFNVGRLFHQLGLLHIACHYYKLVLSLEPEVPFNNLQDEENEQDVGDQVRDLRRAAAFNLSLIYRHSGNKQLALHYIRHYITI
jgi:general transcription factor 3C polypeptide 3 (transcription factor C subunit 4)